MRLLRAMDVPADDVMEFHADDIMETPADGVMEIHADDADCSDDADFSFHRGGLFYRRFN